MKKSIEIAAHIFFWIVFTLFVFMLSKIYLQADPNAPFSQNLVYVVFLEVVMGMIFFYLTFFGLVWTKNKPFKLLVLLMGLVALLLLFAYPATRVGRWEVVSSILPHTIVIFLAGIFRKFSDSIKLEQEKQSLQLQNTKNELALLKMQISPHFLFNTLNNIDYLILHDTEKASNSISKLADILRYMVYDVEKEKIPLWKELKYIEDYIGLIRLRTSGPDYLKYALSGNPAHLQIAPMLFFPLIENAYKHASSKEGSEVIQINISIKESRICFVAENEYDKSVSNNHPGSPGLGMNIVRRRLALLYPKMHSLKVTEGNSRYMLELTLQLDEF